MADLSVDLLAPLLVFTGVSPTVRIGLINFGPAAARNVFVGVEVAPGETGNGQIINVEANDPFEIRSMTDSRVVFFAENFTTTTDSGTVDPLPLGAIELIGNANTGTFAISVAIDASVRSDNDQNGGNNTDHKDISYIPETSEECTKNSINIVRLQEDDSKLFITGDCYSPGNEKPGVRISENRFQSIDDALNFTGSGEFGNNLSFRSGDKVEVNAGTFSGFTIPAANADTGALSDVGVFGYRDSLPGGPSATTRILGNIKSQAQGVVIKDMLIEGTATDAAVEIRGGSGAIDIKGTVIGGKKDGIRMVGGGTLDLSGTIVTVPDIAINFGSGTTFTLSSSVIAGKVGVKLSDLESASIVDSHIMASVGMELADVSIVDIRNSTLVTVFVDDSPSRGAVILRADSATIRNIDITSDQVELEGLLEGLKIEDTDTVTLEKVDISGDFTIGIEGNRVSEADFKNVQVQGTGFALDWGDGEVLGADDLVFIASGCPPSLVDVSFRNVHTIRMNRLFLSGNSCEDSIGLSATMVDSLTIADFEVTGWGTGIHLSQIGTYSLQTGILRTNAIALSGGVFTLTGGVLNTTFIDNDLAVEGGRLEPGNLRFPGEPFGPPFLRGFYRAASRIASLILGSDGIIVFENNTIFGNREAGIRLGPGANFDLGGGAGGSRGGNIIGSNEGFDLINNTGLAISAENNIWDHSDPAEILALDIAPGSDADVEPVLAMQQLHFAQFAEAPGLVSQLTLLAPSRESGAAAVLAIRNAEGQGVNVPLNGDQSPQGLHPGNVPPLGVRFFATDPETNQLNVGSIVAASGLPLAGTVLFSGPTGVAGVGQSELLTAFTAPVELSSSREVNSGIAITNPEEEPVVVTLTLFSNPDQVAQTNLNLPGFGQTAQLLSELFPEVPPEFEGTVRARSATPVAATIIRTSPGQFATLPVTGEGSRRVLFAQFGEAAGLGSTLTLVSASDLDAEVTVEISDDNGDPLTVELNGQEVAGKLNFNLPAGSFASLASPGTSEVVKIGSVVVESTQNIGGTILFGGGFGLAGVGASLEVPSFIAPVQQNSQGTSTGLALMNPGADPVSITLTLRNESGAEVEGGRAEIVLPPRGHQARFISELFPQLDVQNFRGTIAGEAVAAIGATVLIQSSSPLELATLPVVEIVP